MREHGIYLDKFLTGLRPNSNNRFNQDTCVECKGLAPRDEGLIDEPTLYEPINGMVEDFPFPQVFFGHRYWLCCTRDKIYVINPDWSLTLKLSIVTSNPKPWVFVDFFTFVVLTNGDKTVLVNPETGVFYTHISDSTLPRLLTACNYNGQLIAVPADSWYDTNSSFVIWSAIGALDFQIDKSNIKGYMPMPFTGVVLSVLKLDKYIAVYGTGGIVFMAPAGVNWGIVKKVAYGIASRGAVGGDTNMHVFVDGSGSLRTVNSRLEISDPMYQEFFSPMLGKEIIVSHDPLENDFYISDGETSFIKTSVGLGQISYGITGAGVLAGLFTGVAKELSSGKYITTDSMDFGSRSRKTADVTEVGVVTDGKVEIAVDWKMNKADAFSTTRWVEVNNEGVAVLPISGVDLRFKLRCLNSTYFRINHLQPRLKMDDRRARRGTSNAGTFIA